MDKNCPHYLLAELRDNPPAVGDLVMITYTDTYKHATRSKWQCAGPLRYVCIGYNEYGPLLQPFWQGRGNKRNASINIRPDFEEPALRVMAQLYDAEGRWHTTGHPIEYEIIRARVPQGQNHGEQLPLDLA